MELLVALTIFSIGAAAVVGMLTLASRGMRYAEVGFRAALVASSAGVEAAAPEGEEVTEVGVYRWRRLLPSGIEVGYGDGVDDPQGREWRIVPGWADGEGGP